MVSGFMVSPLQGLNIGYAFTQGFTLGYYIAGPSARGRSLGSWRVIGVFVVGENHSVVHEPLLFQNEFAVDQNPPMFASRDVDPFLHGFAKAFRGKYTGAHDHDMSPLIEEISVNVGRFGINCPAPTKAFEECVTLSGFRKELVSCRATLLLVHAPRCFAVVNPDTAKVFHDVVYTENVAGILKINSSLCNQLHAIHNYEAVGVFCGDGNCELVGGFELECAEKGAAFF
jgi:hypothetical protein